VSKSNRPFIKAVPVAVEPKKHYTIKSAAARHSVAIWHVRTLIWSGALPVVKAGKRFVISAEALDRHFAEAEMAV